MDRITEKMLDGAVSRLNKSIGHVNPKWNTVGAYMLDGAYGGWKLVRVVNEQGGQKDISNGGFVSKRELWNQIQTVITVTSDLQTA